MTDTVDNPPFSLADTRVAIIGLGLIGGSLALALKERCRQILAYDPNRQTIERARARQIVDHASQHPAEILPLADLVILAAPIRAIIAWIARLPQWMPDPAVIMDLGSTKAQICRALETLPPRFDPIGGHPMAGKEQSGLAHVEAALFQNAAFALTPLARTTPRARRLAESLARQIGAVPFWIQAIQHDAWVAATSHLPYLISAALASATPPEAQPLVGPGFRSMTRLAASPPAIMLDILTTNQANVLAGIAQFRKQLDILEDMVIADEIIPLENKLSQAAQSAAKLRQGITAGNSENKSSSPFFPFTEEQPE